MTEQSEEVSKRVIRYLRPPLAHSRVIIMDKEKQSNFCDTCGGKMVFSFEAKELPDFDRQTGKETFNTKKVYYCEKYPHYFFGVGTQHLREILYFKNGEFESVFRDHSYPLG